MLINGVDINTLGVRLYDRVLTSNEVETTEDWLDGDFQPTFVRQQDKFKNIKLSFLVLENGESEAFTVMSKLTALLKKATLSFEDIDCSFDVVLNGSSSQQRLKNGKFILTFNLKSDYGKGEEEIYTTDKSATEYFTLSLMYYSDTNTLIASERKTLRRADFAETGNTFDSIGIDLNKHRAEHYQPGVPTNFTGIELTYDNLSKVQALIINYAPMVYTIDVNHFVLNEDSIYDLTTTVKTTFTHPKLLTISTIGELIDLKSHKPEGYIAKVQYDGPLTVEALLENSPISVYYDKPEVDRQKDVSIRYNKETENGSVLVGEKVIIVRESDIVSGTKLKDLIQLDPYKPGKYYDEGALLGEDIDSFITFDELKTAYTIEYPRTENVIHVEYYQGEYPNWFRVSTETIKSKVKERFLDENYQINLKDDLGIDKDSFLSEVYEPGIIVNDDLLDTYEDVINFGVIQIYYVPKDYTVEVRYFQDDMKGDPIAKETITINDVMFLSGSTTIGDIVELNKHKPEGYTLYDYYQGEMTLSAILSSAPLNIVYGPIVAEPEKNITIYYKKELSSTYTTIATETLVIKSSDVAGGVRLGNLINVDKHIPDYYGTGIIDGHSLSQVVEFADLKSSYSVLYMAKKYQTNVRYFTDEVNDLNWIGSDVISYRVIDFEVGTTLYDLGLNLNLFKPAYCGDGELQYTGPVSFPALVQLDAINVVYVSIDEPTDPDIKYPKRFLYLDYNDLKGHENLFPNETFNKAYINTGFTCTDMSKLTVIVEAEKVWSYTNLTDVNVGDAYIFGSKGAVGDGAFGMKYRNNTKYLVPGQDQMPNLYSAVSGSKPITLEEESAVGFSRNTGIYSTERYGYSFATFTYTNTIATDAGPVRYPIYLFANNNQGAYADGIAGVGIYGCKIYYDNELMRDLIPVAFYDKIGDQVAPSNCLYDKVSQTFFEDARGKNSFKIKDDPDWTPDLSHKLGSCFVSYYKGENLFRTATIWFRGDDFKEPWNMRENFFVDYYQPQYHGPGTIVGAPENEEGTFDTLNNKTFKVVYDSLGYNVEVNYYKEDELIATDQLSFEESDFYSNPSFGDLIKINKYKPDGYSTDFKYEGKVVLNQIIANAPYDIVYKPARDIETYTTTIKYYEAIKGENKLLGTAEVIIDSTQFQEGVYIEDFIVWDAKRPVFCGSGEPLDFYLMDEALVSKYDLRESYSIIYRAEPQNVELRYFTDVAEEDNQVASKNWPIRQDKWLPGELINLQESIPYSVVNAYKPEICLAGVVEGEMINFTDLVNKGYVNIIYTTIKEPTDPEGYTFPKKVLFFGDEGKDFISDLPIQPTTNLGSLRHGAKRPWIDTGFKPKDLSRLTMEAKTYALSEGVSSGTAQFQYSTDDYAYYIGYYGALPEQNWEQYSVGYIVSEAGGKFPKMETDKRFRDASVGSAGCCAIKGHWPEASGYVYTSKGPQYIDGFVYMAGGAGATIGPGSKENKNSLTGVWRKSLICQTMDKYGKDYITGKSVPLTNNITQSAYTDIVNSSIARPQLVPHQMRPFTIGMSPYRNESWIYNYKNSNSKKILEVDEETLELQEENRGLPCRPVDSLTLFASRNPDTGKINLPIRDFNTYPSVGGLGSKPGDGVEEWEVTIITGKDDNGDPIYETITMKRENLFKSFPISSNPGVHKAYIWEVKIWDREKLVRHLVPVEEGQVIYDSYVAPSNCLFDIITETFFGNQNKGGVYVSEFDGLTYQVDAKDVLPLKIKDDPSTYGKITVNYYKDGTTFIGNKAVEVPIIYDENNTSYKEIFHLNDMNPDERYYNDGRSDFGGLWLDPSTELPTLEEIYELGYINVFYDPIMFESNLSFYKEDLLQGYRGFSYTIKQLEKAQSLEDLGISLDAFDDIERYKTGRAVFDNTAFTEKRYDEIIALPSIPVIMEKREDTNNFYLEYFRHSASLDYTRDFDTNYIDCDLLYKVVVKDGVDGLNKHNNFVKNVEVVAHYDYKQAIHITKLTSDKTWGLDVEKNAWIELKNLTIRQESKYLRGLAIDILDLDSISWEEGKTYSDFEDLGIDIQAWKLAYHADAINSYEGAYTLEALSSAVGAQFVYPELKYNYNCLYYKDIMEDGKAPIATKPFSFTIGDFDLHWDSFIETNERYLKRQYIKLVKDTMGRSEPGVQYSEVKKVYKHNWYGVQGVSLDGDWYYILDTLDWTWFWVPKVDTEEHTPTPYLGGIGKTWADLGIDANEFKPAGYADGIMLWNAYQFQDPKEQVINLKDLILSGGQKVLYPMKIGKYKALYCHSFTKFEFDEVDVKNYNFEVRAEHLTSSQAFLSTYAGTWYWGQSKPSLLSYGDGFKYAPKYWFGNGLTLGGQIDRPRYDFNKPLAQYIGYTKYDNDYTTGNAVNRINLESYDCYKSFDRSYHLSYDHIKNATRRTIKVHDDKGNAEIKVYQKDHKDWAPFNSDFYNDRVDFDYVGYNDTNKETQLERDSIVNHAYIGSGMYYYREIWDSDRVLLKEYKVFDGKRLVAWFVPLPKGHPIANGGKMPNHGFYDIIKGRTTTPFIHGRKTSVDGSLNNSYKILKDDFVRLPDDEYGNIRFTSYPEMYYFDANVETDKPVDYFGEQNYDTEEVFYPAITTSAVVGYKYPDDYSDELATYPVGQVMPIVRRLKDETWSYNGFCWIKSDALSRETNFTIAEPTVNKVAIKGDTTSGAWALKLEPLAEAEMNGNVADYETIVPISATSGDFLWLDKGWLDFRGTDLHYNTINRNVVVSESIPCYEYPTLQAKTIKTYILGTQLTLTKELVRDNKWAYTGEGWIRTEKVVDINKRKGV